jgi:hypothetical protein
MTGHINVNLFYIFILKIIATNVAKHISCEALLLNRRLQYYQMTGHTVPLTQLVNHVISEILTPITFSPPCYAIQKTKGSTAQINYPQKGTISFPLINP